MSESARDQAASHLAECPRCMAVYAQFARAHLDTSPEGIPSDSDEWVRMGFEVGSSPHREVLPRPKPHPRRRQVLAAAVTIALLAGAILLLRPQPTRQMRLSADTHELVARLAREDSYGNLLYSAKLLPVRGSTRGNGQSFEAQPLKELRDLAALHPDDPDLAFWLIVADLSTNQLRWAAANLTDALRNFPDDPGFTNLAAILAFKRNELPEAEGQLRAALRADRTGVVKLNLVRVLTQLGRREEAEPLTAELRREHPDLAVAAGL